MSERVGYRRSFCRSLSFFLVGLVWVSPASYGEFNARSEFVAKLRAPYVLALESTPFRESLELVAATAQLNLWIDRTVDPDALISPGSLAPTVYECLAKIAAEQNSVLFPIENFVLVGKPERVDAAATAILSLKNATSTTNSLATVHWNQLSTPSEAFAQSMGGGVSAKVNLELPHDLWHETTWQNVDQEVATSLVLSQLGLRLVRPIASSRNPAGLATEQLDGQAKTVTYRYQTESIPSEARKAAQSVDSKAKFKDQPGGMDVSTTSTGHRLFTHALLKSLSQTNITVPANGNSLETLKEDKRMFTLKLANKSATEVFAFLAKTANINVEIDPTAKAKCDGWVSLEAKDASLLQLIEQVAQRTKVKLEWEQGKFRVKDLTQPAN